jgi:hypothetical protein
MNRKLSFMTGIGVGAAVMYLLDPIGGARRRAFVRDKSVSAFSGGQRFVRSASKDISNRMRGTIAALRRKPLVIGDDDVLVERIRTAFGRVVSHPGAVHVMIENGAVRLDGAILAAELRPLMAAILEVEGVQSIDNRLKVSETANDVPGLQGAGSLARRRRIPRSPAARVVMGVAGGAVLAASYALARRSAA